MHHQVWTVGDPGRYFKVKLSFSNILMIIQF
jgi:hypothetical protein